jgi:hypothetical protein
MSDRDVALLSALDAPFEFARQPTPVASSLRPERRVPLLLLLVAKSHGAGASWKGLQVLSWAIRDARHAELFAALQAHQDIPDRPVVRFEPALDRAADLAIGLGLLELKASRVIRLTEKGHRVVGQIQASDAFGVERARLQRIPGKVTQAQVERILEWREA